jgi:hypothetical protein
MSEPKSHLAADNPFSTRCTRPGAMPFIFPSGQSVEMLVARLRDNGWRSEIVGPHGAGKSALLATLIPAIERAGRRTILVELHDRERRLPPIPSGSERSTLLIVDGCEQLSRWNRWWLRRLCRRRGWGLLVTAHASVGLPELCQVSTSLELAETLVDRLMAGRPHVVSAAEIAACFTRHHSDLREMLFDLYDLYEQRR